MIYCYSWGFHRLHPPRFYIPKKPTLKEIYLSDLDYAELSTKFKAMHIKNMIHWIAKKTQEVADANTDVTKLNLHKFLTKKHYWDVVPWYFHLQPLAVGDFDWGRGLTMFGNLLLWSTKVHWFDERWWYHPRSPYRSWSFWCFVYAYTNVCMAGGKILLWQTHAL